MTEILESSSVATAWTALREAGAPPIGRSRNLPAQALALARSLAAPPAVAQGRRRRRLAVGAGAVVELEQGGGAGAPRLEPAPHVLPGLQRARADVRAYRVQGGGKAAGGALEEGSVVLVSRRRAEEGDLLLVTSLAGLRLVQAGEGGQPISLAEVRVLGTVEGVIRGLQRSP